MSLNADDAAAQHVVRTLRALELLALGPQTQAALARDLVVHRRTARRLIGRLVAEGYATEVQDGRNAAYAATPRLAVLGRRVADGLDLVALGRRHLEVLDDAQATSRFVAFLGDDRVWMPVLERLGNSAAGAPSEVMPHRGALHASAAGKVFLSADNTLAGDVLNQELLGFTAKTLVKRADLLLELAEVRVQGYATEDGEHRADLRTVASGVRNHVGRTVAALGLSASPDADLAALGRSARAAARAFSAEIGAPPDDA